MRSVIDGLLYGIWHVGRVPGIAAVALLSALPSVLMFSWLFDPPPPTREVGATAVNVFECRVVGARVDQGVAIITIRNVVGLSDAVLSGLVIPEITEKAAISYIMSRTAGPDLSVVYTMFERAGPKPQTIHLVQGDLWLNGALVERGLARVIRPSESASPLACRANLEQLQDQATYHQRGVWARRQ